MTLAVFTLFFDYSFSKRHKYFVLPLRNGLHLPPPLHCFLILVCEDSAEYKEIGVSDESGSSIQNGKFETVDVII